MSVMVRWSVGDEVLVPGEVHDGPGRIVEIKRDDLVVVQWPDRAWPGVRERCVYFTQFLRPA